MFPLKHKKTGVFLQNTPVFCLKYRNIRHLKIDVQNLFVGRFAHAGTDNHTNQCCSYTDENLMDACNLKSKQHGYAVYQCPSHHRPDCSGFVRFLPEESQQEDPYERTFQTTESKHVNFPDNIRRIDGNCENCQSQNQIAQLAERFCAGFRYRCPLLSLLIQIHVFNDGRCRRKKKRGNSGNGCCNWPNYGNAGQQRRQ